METLSATQEKTLIDAGLCNGLMGHVLGLSFADRDLEVIEVLSAAPTVPDPAGLPSAAACATALNVELRWASMVVERVGRFMTKARLGGDYSAHGARFNALKPVAALIPQLQKLQKGHTLFIGDSSMDSRHWGADASYPVLAGRLLQQLGAGTYLNAGIGGETARQGLARFDQAVSNMPPVRTVIAFGGNDLSCGVMINDIVTTMSTLITKFQALGSTVIVAGLAYPLNDRMWWAPAPRLPDADITLGKLNDAYAALTARLGAALLHVAPTMNADDRCSDGLHFSQSGQDKLSLLLLRQWAGPFFK